MNPTVRGFLIIFLISGLITALSLESAVTTLFFLVRIVFFLAIALLIFFLWRDRRSEISLWPVRSRVVLYGGVLLAVINLGLAFALDYPSSTGEVLIFIAVLGGSVYAVFRVWRDQMRYANY